MNMMEKAKSFFSNKQTLLFMSLFMLFFLFKYDYNLLVNLLDLKHIMIV